MSRARTFAILSSVLVACGGAEDSGLFQGGKTPALDGTGGGEAGGDTGSGGAVTGSGGTADAAGGAGTAGHAPGDGPDASASPDATPNRDSGTDAAGGAPSEEGGALGGAGGAPSGAWTRCQKDSECVGGRVCTAPAQSILVSGRPGACVHHCIIGPGGCDAPLPGATVSCTQLLIDSFCTFTCARNGDCPDGMDCITGACFYRN